MTRIVALFFGVLVFGAAVFVGAVFIAGLIGLILIGSLIFMLRVWWLKRQMEKYEQTHGDLEAEYTILDDDAGRPRNAQDRES